LPLQRFDTSVELSPERGGVDRQTSQEGRHGIRIETSPSQEMHRFAIRLFLGLGIVVLHQVADLIIPASCSCRPTEVLKENMRHLMRQHRRELGLIPHEGHQPICQNDVPIPGGEGARRKIPSDIESPSLAPWAV
jgi:hypothetical protein